MPLIGYPGGQVCRPVTRDSADGNLTHTREAANRRALLAAHIHRPGAQGVGGVDARLFRGGFARGRAALDRFPGQVSRFRRPHGLLLRRPFRFSPGFGALQHAGALLVVVGRLPSRARRAAEASPWLAAAAAASGEAGRRMMWATFIADCCAVSSRSRRCACNRASISVRLRRFHKMNPTRRAISSSVVGLLKIPPGCPPAGGGVSVAPVSPGCGV